MKYTEVVRKIADRTLVSCADVRKVLEAFGSVISESLAESDERVCISKFGSFQRKKAEERTYTGGACAGKTSPTHYRIKFKAYKAMTEALPNPTKKGKKKSKASKGKSKDKKKK